MEIFGSISAVVLGEGCFFYLMVWVFVMLDDLITLIYLWLLFHRKAGFGCCVSDKIARSERERPKRQTLNLRWQGNFF